MMISTERMELMSRLLDIAALRQDVTAQNVANVNTPGFRSLDVSFEEALKERLSADPHAPVADVQPEVIPGAGGVARDDGNNVDVDLEMARLQKNAIYFKVYSQILANELAQQRSAITGR
jgi:flagellar basal-body rod protein FlgB